MWIFTNKGNTDARKLADRHYTRQSVGNPQFTRPGKNLVLITEDKKAVWVTWSGIRDDGFEAWECTIFRNEGPYLSSHLIVLALGITRNLWGEPPKDGIITYIGKHLKGGTFHAAGFKKAGESKKNKLLRLQLTSDRFTPPLEPAFEGLFKTNIIIK